MFNLSSWASVQVINVVMNGLQAGATKDAVLVNGVTLTRDTVEQARDARRVLSERRRTDVTGLVSLEQLAALSVARPTEYIETSPWTAVMSEAMCPVWQSEGWSLHLHCTHLVLCCILGWPVDDVVADITHQHVKAAGLRIVRAGVTGLRQTTIEGYFIKGWPHS